MDRALNHYHYGKSESTGAQYRGVDMRGEVILLSRNVKIVGNDTENWGCQVLTSDFVESNGEVRFGRTYIDSVEIYNCSQQDTHKAALRFESAEGSWSRVSNSAIHHGSGLGMEISLSSSVQIMNNDIFDHVKFGISVITSRNITLDGNWVHGIFARHLKVESAGDPMAAIASCAHLVGDRCFNVVVTNNVVSSVEPGGIDTVGYSVMASECGDTQNVVFKNNIAHSIGGNGANIFRNISSKYQRNCLEASNFIAYKCKAVGIVANQLTDNVIFRDMILIDNGHSAAPMVGVEGEDQSIVMNNVVFFGETEARDCQVENVC